MNTFDNNGYTSYTYSAEPLSVYTAKTFGWMFAGLLTTFLIAMAGYITGAILYIFYVPYVTYLLLFAELGVVVYLSARIEKLSPGTARALFFRIFYIKRHCIFPFIF